MSTMNDEKKERLYARSQRLFSSLYEISLCRAEEIDEVTAFIDTYWKKGHSLVTSRELMDWQHRDPVTGEYHFVIARSRESGEIHAIEGFIPTTQFDPEIAEPMTWGAIWKTREDAAPPGLGVAVKQFREHQYPSPFAMEVGISADAARYNRQMKKPIFQLVPWYIANPEIADYRLFAPPEENAGECPEENTRIETGHKTEQKQTAAAGSSLTQERWESLEGSFSPEAIPPYKSHTYYLNRYFNHPVYQYEALLLQDREGAEAPEVLFYRIVRAEGRKGIFLVDYIGTGRLLSRSNRVLHDLMSRESAEYILFLCAGLPEELLRAAGFADSSTDHAVTPVYYEPFLRRNVTINCTSEGAAGWPVYKGDADQDRPSVLPVGCL